MIRFQDNSNSQMCAYTQARKMRSSFLTIGINAIDFENMHIRTTKIYIFLTFARDELIRRLSELFVIILV